MKRLHWLGRCVLASAVFAATALTGCGEATPRPDQGDQPAPVAVETPPTPRATPPAAGEPSGSAAPVSSAPTPTRTSSPVPARPAVLGEAEPTSVQPNRLVVADLGIDMPLVPLGVDEGGMMALHPDPAVAAWYRYGPVPGDDAGASVVAAHVDSAELGIGPFAALSGARPGTVVTITDGAGGDHSYRIESVTSIPLEDLDLPSLFDRAGPHRLHVVTCGGPYLRELGGYQKNVVVVAVPIN